MLTLRSCYTIVQVKSHPVKAQSPEHAGSIILAKEPELQVTFRFILSGLHSVLWIIVNFSHSTLLLRTSKNTFTNCYQPMNHKFMKKKIDQFFKFLVCCAFKFWLKHMSGRRILPELLLHLARHKPRKLHASYLTPKGTGAQNLGRVVLSLASMYPFLVHRL